MSCFANPAMCVYDWVTDAGGKVASGAWEAVCKSFAEAASDLMASFADAFVTIPPIDLASGGVRNAYAISLGIAGVVAGLLVLFQVIRTVATHDGAPVAQAVVGLGKAVMAFVLTLTVASTALRAADELANRIVVQSYGSTEELTKKLGNLVAWNKGVSASLLLVMAIIGILLTIVLWFEMLLRNAAIAVLVATSPIAAAGQVSETTRHWWSRLASATIQLIILKPVIALVFCLGLSLTGGADDIETLLAGMLVLLMAAVAWPAIARFFTFASVQMAGGAGLAGLLGFMAGRHAGSALAGAGGVSPADFARHTENRTMAAVAARSKPDDQDGGSAGSHSSAGSAGVFGSTGPLGLARFGAAKAARVVNSVASGMERMAGHAGMPGANPYNQPAGPPRPAGQFGAPETPAPPWQGENASADTPVPSPDAPAPTPNAPRSGGVPERDHGATEPPILNTETPDAANPFAPDAADPGPPQAETAQPLPVLDQNQPPSGTRARAAGASGSFVYPPPAPTSPRYDLPPPPPPAASEPPVAPLRLPETARPDRPIPRPAPPPTAPPPNHRHEPGDHS